ncbi:proline-rich protein 2-like [Penaeus monodon]|uniref:proline-rich protein 2-like n=1 Tax=Penaeus monodon TaxID=6687 RepID=UPI0018A7B9D8|nr:proline-rich protein 2-like [Penaeus monodon]
MQSGPPGALPGFPDGGLLCTPSGELNPIFGACWDIVPKEGSRAGPSGPPQPGKGPLSPPQTKPPWANQEAPAEPAGKTGASKANPKNRERGDRNGPGPGVRLCGESGPPRRFPQFPRAPLNPKASGQSLPKGRGGPPLSKGKNPNPASPGDHEKGPPPPLIPVTGGNPQPTHLCFLKPLRGFKCQKSSPNLKQVKEPQGKKVFQTAPHGPPRPKDCSSRGDMSILITFWVTQWEYPVQEPRGKRRKAGVRIFPPNGVVPTPTVNPNVTMSLITRPMVIGGDFSSHQTPSWVPAGDRMRLGPSHAKSAGHSPGFGVSQQPEPCKVRGGVPNPTLATATLGERIAGVRG